MDVFQQPARRKESMTYKADPVTMQVIRYGGVYERNSLWRRTTEIPLNPPLRKGETEHKSSP